MVQAALIEDSGQLAELESSYIKASWRLAEKLELHIFNSAEAFLKESGRKFDILIADIELPGLSGIEVVRQLRLRGDKTAVIFLTAYDGFALKSYELEAEHYILKSQMKTRIPKVLNELGERIISGRKRYRMLVGNSEVEKLYYDDILYFYKDGKYVVYVTQNGELKERISLEAVCSEMGGFPFVKIERGFVINARHLVKLSDDRIRMDNLEELPVSRRLLPLVKKEINLNRSKL